MDGREFYRDQRHVSWSRVEMLLALYDGALQSARRSQEEQQSGDVLQAQRSRLHAARIVMELRAGLNLDMGELPTRIDQLLEFVQFCLFEAGPRLDDAIEILQTLRAGYEGICEEAIRLESQGVIPPVERSLGVQRQV